MTSAELAKRLSHHVVFNKAKPGVFYPQEGMVRNCAFNNILLKRIYALVDKDPDVFAGMIFEAYCFDHWNGLPSPKE